MMPACDPEEFGEHFAGADRQTRRQFLKNASAAAMVSAAEFPSVLAPASSTDLIDVNASVGPWAFRHLPHADAGALVKLLGRKHVRQAWTGNLESLLHKDLGAANTRLAAICKTSGAGILVPLGSINPTAPDWREELSRCARTHRMPGIRLHPNYHGYKLDNPAFAELLKEAVQLKLLVQIALVMEDERMMHPLGRVAPVDTAPLAGLVRSTPGLRLILVNALRTLRARPLLELVAAGDVSVEVSMLEGIGGLESLLGQLPVSRVLFGSHAPLFYFDSALLKLKESVLNERQGIAIRSGNARRIMETNA